MSATEQSDDSDTVHSSVSYTLPTGIHNLILDGSDPITGTGNALDNMITGNSADNTLDGRGGADTMAGGDGNDTYYVDNVGDKVIETATGGIDLIHSTVSYSLPDNVERLSLSGSADINAFGNVLDNILTGNVGNNTLYGGFGADTMIGGAGNDTYYVDNAGDRVVEFANNGIDLVHSTISYTLPDNVERLTLDGSANINGTGNALSNLITGNSGDNILSGGGGTGDAFRFIGTIGHDTVTDFIPTSGAGHDVLQIDTGLFANYADVMAHAAQNGSDVVITHDAANSITLHDVALANLVAADFQFV